jgi:hypothetical protein
MSNETRSGNPAKKAAAKKTAAKKASTPKAPEVHLDGPSSLAEFKARKSGRVMALPSGLVAKVRKVDLQSFVIQGTVPNPLMGMVSEALEKGQKAEPAKMMGVEEGEVDLDMVRDMYELVNAIVCEMFLEPKVLPVPENEGDREDDLLYIDELDEEDKMFLFQWITGGTDDVAQFREEAAADMASLAKS